MWTCDVPFKSSDVTDGQAEMISNWVDAAEKGTELIAPGYEGINSLSLSNAMYLSTWKDSWIELPFDEDEFLERLQEKIKTSTFVKQTTKLQDVDMESSFQK